MSETKLSSGSRASKVGVAAIIAFAIVALSCIVAFTVTVVLVLDAIPFYHIFPH